MFHATKIVHKNVYMQLHVYVKNKQYSEKVNQPCIYGKFLEHMSALVNLMRNEI